MDFLLITYLEWFDVSIATNYTGDVTVEAVVSGNLIYFLELCCLRSYYYLYSIDGKENVIIRVQTMEVEAVDEISSEN